MPEIRQDPLLDRWVIVAENRATRPDEYARVVPQRRTAGCIFCPGNEAQTPEPFLVRRPANWNGNPTEWLIRAIANRFPALEGIADEAAAPPGDGLFRTMPGHGVHEVVVDTPRHVASISEESEDLAAELFRVYRDRLQALCDVRGIVAALVFKNVGATAGASIEHAHSQLLAMPQLPPAVRAEWLASREYHGRTGECPFCRTIDEERRHGRVVEEDALAVAFCPFASRFAYETWVLPRRHESHLESGDDAALAAVARLTRRVVLRLEAVLDRPAYNYVIHTAPFDSGPANHYHWHVELYPRATPLAAFEVGTGCSINSVAPERAAERLRAAVA